MMWTLTPVRVGECDVRDYITFAGGDQSVRRFVLYVWILRGPGGPIIVDTGPSDPEGFSRSTAEYIPGGVRQAPGERTPVALRAHGIEPAEVPSVIITHLHPDHYDFLPIFETARVFISGQGFEEGRPALPPEVAAYLEESGRLRLVGDEEVVPGVSILHLGVHSPCSQAVVVDTDAGRAALMGDVAYLYDNLREDRPIGGVDAAVWHRAIARARSAADHLVPGHDPLVLHEFGG
ncbi:MAG: MBL fold metallo-hydrolase [Armatimonadia bacterium]|nr:MBL fold metallo-hydrolase [Armatimonadia bacterium]